VTPAERLTDVTEILPLLLLLLGSLSPINGIQRIA